LGSQCPTWISDRSLYGLSGGYALDVIADDSRSNAVTPRQIKGFEWTTTADFGLGPADMSVIGWRHTRAMDTTGPATAKSRARGVALVATAGALLGVGLFILVREVATPRRTTPFYDPPVLAGQQLWGYCAGGVYARRGDTIVLTSTGHCTSPGTVAHDPDGIGVRGTFGEPARDPTCPYPGHVCAASDINELVVAPDRIPWGHLNVVDLGTAGYRVIPEGTRPLGCAEIAVGDRVEIDGRNTYRQGKVLEKGENLKDARDDASYFPCMVIADVGVAPGDSGGVVLVRGIPAGVTSRSFGGYLGFTPLAEGLAQLGLELCTTPHCGLEPPIGAGGLR
jgi:hypothetical protein